MVIAVIERRNEIGLRRALGATRGHIRTQFLSEAVLRFGDSRKADLKIVTLHRRGAKGGDDLIMLDLSRILKTGDRNEDIELKNGDRIELREKGF